VLNSGMLVGCLIGAWIALPTMGVVGAGVAWTLSQTVGAAWVLMSWKAILNPVKHVDHEQAAAVVTDVRPVAAEGSAP